MNEWTNERINEWMNEWMNEWTDEIIFKWMNMYLECVNTEHASKMWVHKVLLISVTEKNNSKFKKALIDELITAYENGFLWNKLIYESAKSPLPTVEWHCL